MSEVTELAERFAAITERHLEAPLAGGVRAREVGRAVFGEVRDAIAPRVFPATTIVQLAAFESDGPPAPLRDTELRHHVAFYDGDRAVGCFAGHRDHRGWYRMGYTAIDPDYQNRGIYGSFLERLLGLLDEVGFDVVSSRHQADNNQVLVPKLKRGFVIAAFELTVRYGVTVELRRYLNPGFEKIHSFRIDGARNHGELRRLKVIAD